MSSPSDFEARTIRAKRPAAQPTPAQHGQMTSFFLRSEAEMDKSTSIEDKDMSLDHSMPSFVEDDDSAAASVADTSYGVQSLDDAMRIGTDTLARTSSNESTSGLNVKRRPGNPVHPKILATGQRIVSSEQASHPPANDSPQRAYFRRASLSSSTHLTPLNMSPHPDHASSGTPRTNSLKSFRLSDEEASVTSDTGSQAIQSSSSEECEQQLSAGIASSPEPQLVMPSITMPQRRPFTQRGRSMGQMKIMVAGACGIGKTSLIRNIFRLCEDIVHIDGITGSTPSQSTSTSKSSSIQPTTAISELQASTKPQPTWWSDLESSRSWWQRKSFGEGVLERNLRIVDTPGVDSDSMAQRLLKEIDKWFAPIMSVASLKDTQLFALLNGKSDIHLDAIVYLFTAEDQAIADEELSLLHEISLRTNLIPLIARSDTVDAEALESRRCDLLETFHASNIDICSLVSPHASQGHEIYAISSLTDDGDIMDASTLMASTYLPPLKPSDLQTFITRLLDPSTIERLRHQSIAKLVLLRRQQMSQLPISTRQTAGQLAVGNLASAGALDADSKVLFPPSYSSYYRSTSPSSDASDFYGQPPFALPQHHQIAGRSRQTHVAKWARDLQHSLRGEGVWQHDQNTRPLKGRLGGDLAVIDPKDPLGIFSLTQAFGRRGLFALQIVGGCGLLSAAVWWLARSYLEWQTWVWPGQEGYFSALALPAPTRSWLDAVKMI